VTLRAGGSAFAFTAVAIVGALLLADAVLRGSWTAAVRTAGPVILVVWVAWLLLLRPSIRIQPDRAVVINVGRITEVPWSRIVDIRRRLQLVLDLDDGRRLEAWGSPFLSKRRDSEDSALMALRGAWMSGPASEAPVIRRVDVMALTVGAVAIAAAGLSLGVAR
jgi:hypothetical protein